MEEQEKEKSGKEIKEFLSEQVSCFVSHIFYPTPPSYSSSTFHCATASSSFSFFLHLFLLYLCFIDLFFNFVLYYLGSICIPVSFLSSLPSAINHTIQYLTMLCCTALLRTDCTCEQISQVLSGYVVDYFEKEVTHLKLLYLEGLRRAVGDDPFLITKVCVCVGGSVCVFSFFSLLILFFISLISSFPFLISKPSPNSLFPDFTLTLYFPLLYPYLLLPHPHFLPFSLSPF